MWKKFCLHFCIFLFSMYTYSQVGINTDTPQASLDIEGDLRISPSYTSNVPTNNLTLSSPLYVDRSSGSVSYAPEGFTRVVGGLRPGTSNIISTFPISNTIAMVRFVFYVHKSNATNNSRQDAYAYGDFKIIGTGASDPIRFLDVNIYNTQGSKRTLDLVNDSTISWSNSTLGTTTLSLDRNTGNFNITTVQPVFSYFFEILGGI